MRSKSGSRTHLWTATIVVVLLIAHPGKCEEAFKALATAVGFVTVEKQVYEKAALGGSERVVEVWHRDPISGQQRPKTQTASGTYFPILWHGNTYLVTAKHVIIDGAGRPAEQGSFHFNDKEGKRKTLTFQFMEEKPSSRWFLHDTADVAIHPMWRPIEVEMVFSSITDANPQTNVVYKPSILESVYAIGFPLGLGVGESLSPIAKECKIASLKQELKGQAENGIPISGTFILLDQALAQGYSGSPIYSCPAPNTLCLLGVMSSVNTDATGGKISLVVPMDYVIEILKSPQFVAYEALHGLGKPKTSGDESSKDKGQPPPP